MIRLNFEGEFKNGERNGQGKEYYDNGKLKVWDEYLIWNKWNGTGYDINNNIVNEIHYGKGYVKEYSSDGNLIFEGVYRWRKSNGNGKGNTYYYKFEADFINGLWLRKKEYYNN